MAIDYVGLNQAVGASGPLGLAANFISRERDRDFSREELDKRVGLEQAKLDILSRQGDQGHERGMRELDLMEQQNDYMSRYYDAQTRGVNADTDAKEFQLDRNKMQAIDQDTAAQYRAYYQAAISKGLLVDGNVDAPKAVQDAGVMQHMVRALNNPYHAKAISNSIPGSRENGAKVVARYNPETGMVDIGIEGRDKKLMPLPGQDDSIMDPDEFVAYVDGVASPAAYANARGPIDVINSMTEKQRNLLNAMAGDSMSETQRLATEGKAISTDAGLDRQVDRNIALANSDPNRRVANREADNLLGNDTISKFGLTAEAQFDDLIKDKAGPLSKYLGIGNSALETIKNPQQFAEAMKKVYYGNQGELVSLGFPEKLADYTERDHQLLAEITAAVHENDDAWPKILKYWGPGLVMNLAGFMNPDVNNKVTPEVKERFSTLADARRN